jgi:hypothetical protein
MCPISDRSRGKDPILTKISREISGEEALLPSMDGRNHPERYFLLTQTFEYLKFLKINQ